MSQDPTAKPQSYNLQETLARIDAMEAKFDSIKDDFKDGINKLEKQIIKASRIHPNQYTQCKESFTQSRSKPKPDKPDKPDTGYARAEADCKEFFDDPQSLNIKIKKLAQLIKKSKHFVAFTGAGISTAAGIADFRSGINTALDTGTGKWARQTAIRQGKSKQIKKAKKKSKGSFKTIPTASHMALVALMSQGPKYLKYLVSQNTDGLHRRSGIPPCQMSELHGNSALEICMKCKKEYLRDYRCRGSLRKQSVHDHKTGRYCTVANCKGQLQDTIINFNEMLPKIPLDLADEHHENADLCLVLGSSLTVTPAKNMPENVGFKWDLSVSKHADKEPTHNLCIVNLQKTDCDDLCSVRIFAKIDDVMIGLMNELDITIPKWNLNRFVKIKLENTGLFSGLFMKLIVCGVDSDGIDATIFTAIKLKYNGQKIIPQQQRFISAKEKLFHPDEYVFNITKQVLEIDENESKNDDVCSDINDKGLVLELMFYGHYNEPNLFISLDEYLKDLNDGYIVLKMEMNPVSKMWNVGNRSEQLNDENVKKLWSIYQEEVTEKEEKKEKKENNNNQNDEDDYAKKYFTYDDD